MSNQSGNDDPKVQASVALRVFATSLALTCGCIIIEPAAAYGAAFVIACFLIMAFIFWPVLKKKAQEAPDDHRPQAQKADGGHKQEKKPTQHQRTKDGQKSRPKPTKQPLKQT